MSKAISTTKNKIKAKSKFDKYQVYTEVVQSPGHDARFLRGLYTKLVGHKPVTLREDFCGTHALARAWVELGSEMRGIGIEIDPEPIQYGKERDSAALSQGQLKRLNIVEASVLSPGLPKADIICAFNFSYFCFHSREVLLKYFKRVRVSLNKSGIFVLDIFGGTQHGAPSCDTKRLPGMRYEFQQEFFDPISNSTRFYLNFYPRGQKAQKKAFTYDWRMWSIPEVRDILKDAGFKTSTVYWEGTAKNGRGSGRYHPREKGESCQVWTAYIVALA